MAATTNTPSDTGRALPPGWQVVRFDQMAESITERVDDPAEAGVEYYVGLEHLDPESLHIRRWGHPTDVAATKLRFQPGDIIFGRRRAYQRKLAVAEFEGICSAHALVLRARDETVLPEFLPFFMQSELFFERALQISVGSLSPTINWKTLAKEEFPVPPMEEQRRIADILWAADDVVDEFRSLTNTLRSIPSCVFERVTEACSIVPLSAALNSITAGRSPAASSSPALAGQLGVLKVSAIGENGFNPGENKRLLAESSFRAGLEVRPGDLLVTRANAIATGVGRACIVTDTPHGLMLSDKTLRLSVNDGVALGQFIYHGLRTKRCRDYIERELGGTDAKNISQSKLRNAPIPLPDLASQHEIIAKIMMIQGSADLACDHLRRARNTRTTLLDSFTLRAPTNV